jgi:hypothetical protein
MPLLSIAQSAQVNAPPFYVLLWALGSLQKADEDYYLTAMYILKLANRAPEIFEGSEPAAKRQILKILLQNCVVNDATLVPTIRSPFDQWAEGASRHKWFPLVDKFRNFLQSWEAPILIRQIDELMASSFPLLPSKFRQ